MVKIDAQPKLNVAARTLNLDKVWAKGYTGKGVTIAIVDTGIDRHPDLKDKIIGFFDVVNNKKEPYDDEGHGTHVAGIAAGTGKASDGKYKGGAPDASLVGVKVLNKNGSGSYSNVIRGVQWVVENKDKYNIKVMNLSLGGTPSGSYKDDLLAQAVEVAYAKGILPVVAAGNSGPSKETILTPGYALSPMTIGAMDDNRTIDRSDDDMAWFSSCGPTPYDKLDKPDVITPGVDIEAPKAGTDSYVALSGTSMAAPLAAGIAAIMFSINRDIAPAKVKDVLMSTAVKLPKYDKYFQGRGVIDPLKAINFF